ncbi:LIM and calponin homology domains-containing protein 1 isoform X2 [Ascaphus truei]|uniref:LIM and calponin homology domains-containing protein 1 isoform X2 n=1 Tax=Ascaphus truei TaxID=8439 RepID=UPI003F5A3394
MASPALDLEEISQPQESPPDSACREAQKWIEEVTGRSFGDKDFRAELENGILLCELLNAIKPGLVRKINRLPTPIAGLVLVTVYWLGKAANSCTSYSGKTLDLKAFEGLLAHMRKENEEIESPKRSIRDSGYIDCWESERSDSLSPPRHGRDDSFDSLDSFGSRSQQTPSPDVVLRGSSDGRGSDSESDLPHRRIPDVRKDDMSARRVSYGENKAFVPFNQYLPNKSNPTTYIPAPLRKKKAEREDYRKSWSTATSPLGGERPFSQSHHETIKEEQNETYFQCEEDETKQVVNLKDSSGKNGKVKIKLHQNEGPVKEQSPISDIPKDAEEVRRLKNLEQAGIKVMPATKRYGSQKQPMEDGESAADMVLRKENTLVMCREGMDIGSEEVEDCRVPDIERDDLATRRARINQLRITTPFNQFVHGSYMNKNNPLQKTSKTSSDASPKKSVDKSNYENQGQQKEKQIVTRKKTTFLGSADKVSDTEVEQEKVPDVQRDDLAKRKTQSSISQQKEPLVFAVASITKTDMETWQRLTVSSENSENEHLVQPSGADQSSTIDVSRAANDDFGRRKLSLQEKRARNKQKFVHFGPVTEIDQQRWDRLCIAKPGSGEESEADVKDGSASDRGGGKAISSSLVQSFHCLENTTKELVFQKESSNLRGLAAAELCRGVLSPAPPGKGDDAQLLDTQRDDMLARRTGACKKLARPNQLSPMSNDQNDHDHHKQKKGLKTDLDERKPETSRDESQLLSRLLLNASASKYLKTPISGLETSSLINTEKPAEVKEDLGGDDGSTEMEAKAPDPEKDDMMTRRISVGQKQPSINVIGYFLPVPFSVQQKEEGKPHFSPQKEKKLMSSIPPSSMSNNPPQTLAPVMFDNLTKPFHQNETEEQITELRDDLTCLQTCESVQSNSAKVNPNCTGLNSQLQKTLERCDHEVLRFSPRAALSDDAESISMCDMRYEEEASMLPHSRVHHELLQSVNDQLKEEDDTWQDDLARWKTRRRSASQDLIKKEQERKKMERLLSGESDLSERRKSIKTYKEIVEEKERREKELHEAYKNAKSKEEAEKILQKYIERFTISEAVLERLVMPNILERSHSMEPSLLSSSEDPNPLKYLRQESLPAPKYTATVEATIVPNSESVPKVPAGRTSPSKNVVSKAVPMLTPKPYSQPKNTQHVFKAFKVDGKISMNGETFNGLEEQKEKGCGNLTFAPSLTSSQRFEGVARVDTPIEVLKQDDACIELNFTKSNLPNSYKELKGFPGETNHTTKVDEIDSAVNTERIHSAPAGPGGDEQPRDVTQGMSAVTSLAFTPCIPLKESAVNGKDSEEEMKLEAKALIMHWSLDSDVKEQNESVLPQLFKKAHENGQETSQRAHFGETECSENPSALIPTLNSPNRFNFCSWDPEEERRRQERWQQEQERLLQERYQKEQEKLKEEWEKAQKEVEEEERKYYEEERQIIEDTMPLTVSPNPVAHLSSEWNGNTAPELKEHGHGDQENNTEKAWSESQRYLKDDAQPEDCNEQQTVAWAQEGPLQRGGEEEDQIKGNMKLDMEQAVIMAHKEGGQEDHVSIKECITPTRLNSQFKGDEQMTSAESPLSGDVRSQNNVENENAVQQSKSSVTTRRTDSQENIRGTGCSSSTSTSQCQSPNRSVSGKKLCSTCGLPLGKGAAMIIETLSLYFHIQCFKCGICKGQLGDAITGTDVRIRNGLLNCNDCYIRSRTAGHPTPL